jgi:hypothetical protein
MSDRKLIVLSFGLLLVALSGCSDRADRLRLIEPRLPIDKAIAREFANLLDEESSVSVTLVPSIDSHQSGIEALIADRADIALVSNNEPFTKEISSVMPMYASVLHILVDHTLLPGNATGNRAPGDEKQLVELFTSGKVYAGPEGSPSRVMLTNFALENGASADALQFMDQVSADSSCPKIFVIFSPILRDLKSRLSLCGDGTSYKMISLGEPESLGQGSTAESSTLLNPSLRIFVIPARLYGTDITPEATVALAVDKMLVARNDVSDATIYNLISEVLRLRPALAATEPTLFQGLDGEFDSSDSTFVLHPGSQAYIERNEPNVYERYSGVAEVVVTIIFALFSGFIAAVRIYNIRRKNRIDTFYAQAIDLRTGITHDSSSQQRIEVISKLRVLEKHAFQLLVDEKLAADESFRIFITLINDIIRELKEPSAPDWAVSDT